MSEQHYASPKADLSASGLDINLLLEPLRATKGWVRLCSIVGFVSCAFMVIAGLGVIAGGAAFQGAGQAGMGAGLGVGLGLGYLVFSLLYFFPSLYLFRYASNIGKALVSENMSDVVDALENQKSFWKFAGVIVLIMLVFFVLGVGSAIVLPMLMMGQMQ